MQDSTIRFHGKLHAKENKTRGEGQWTFPGVHLLNGHLIARKMTPISFSHIMDADEACKDGERASHDKTIWTQRKKARIENRPSALNQYKAFAKDVFGKDFKLPEDEGEPTATRVVETAGKRRRSFGFSESSRKK